LHFHHLVKSGESVFTKMRTYLEQVSLLTIEQVLFLILILRVLIKTLKKDVGCLEKL